MIEANELGNDIIREVAWVNDHADTRRFVDRREFCHVTFGLEKYGEENACIIMIDGIMVAL